MSREFIDALILMDDAKYTQAIEALRCIRWKAFHFQGPFLATCGAHPSPLMHLKY